MRRSERTRRRIQRPHAVNLESAFGLFLDSHLVMGMTARACATSLALANVLALRSTRPTLLLQPIEPIGRRQVDATRIPVPQISEVGVPLTQQVAMDCTLIAMPQVRVLEEDERRQRGW